MEIKKSLRQSVFNLLLQAQSDRLQSSDLLKFRNKCQ